MPLVFVHGVTVRKEGDYDRNLENRDTLFRTIVLSDAQGTPYPRPTRNPYWGGHASKFRWSQAAVPQGEFVALGSTDPLLDPLLTEIPRTEASGGGETFLSDVARGSFSGAIDLLLAAALADSGNMRLGAFAREAAAYAAREPHPAWIVAGQSNDDFVEKLIEEVGSSALASRGQTAGAAPPAPAFQSLGFNDLLNNLLDGADRVKNAAAGWISSGRDQAERWVSSKKDEAGHWVSQQLVSRYRGALHASLSAFVGDVLVYINERGDASNPGPIPLDILGDIESAFAERTDADPLILVGHSMGGVILYDLLTGYLPTRLPNLKVDVLVTVGSQVGLFEELKQYHLRDDRVPGPGGPRMPRPANVKRWINIFDTTDVLSFAAAPIFDGVDDFAFSSETDSLSSHSAYFLRPSFYERLRARLSSTPTEDHA